ncbi:hypothetical protein INS43_01740 [Corynebacterium aurimucosum]|uniref:hypothetical protein n=1 Tax=Corynebacterium aurimucosum TaxID=169292 RepID=UPI001879499D|nr:hypothetical protein [Corynebacterium aurimucosum]MBE7363915.1 hypothetical protein [Corynebacterium aurimucosum]
MNPAITEMAQLLEGASRAQNDLTHDILLGEFEARYKELNNDDRWEAYRTLREAYDAAENRDPQAFDEARREAGFFEEAAIQ